MKKIAVLLALVLWVGVVLAQEKPDSIQKQKTKPILVPVQEENYLIFDKGKLYEVKKEAWIEVKVPVTLKNGIVVNKDGSYQTQDKKQRQLKNGEYLDLKGNHYPNKSRFKEHRPTTEKEIEIGHP